MKAREDVVITPAVRELMTMEKELISAAELSKVLPMHPNRMVQYAKAGTWDRNVCNYIVSGRNVKFFRIDFLRKGGWIQ